MSDDKLRIHALADNELSESDKAAAEQHLAECPECRAEYEAVGSLKSVLQIRLEAVEIGDSWNRCRKRLDEIDRSKRVESFVSRYAWAFCAFFLAVILGASLFNRHLGTANLTSGELSQITSGLIPYNADGRGNPAAVQRFVSDALRSAGLRPQSKDHRPLEVAHGKFGNHETTRLAYRDQDGYYFLLVISNARVVDGLAKIDSVRDYYAGTIDGANCVAWSERGYALIVAGNRSIADLCAIADSLTVR